MVKKKSFEESLKQLEKLRPDFNDPQNLRTQVSEM